jgi:hypothetical protein
MKKPSVEQMQDAIKKEIRAIKEEFLENFSRDQECKEAQEEQVSVLNRQEKTATSE